MLYLEFLLKKLELVRLETALCCHNRGNNKKVSLSHTLLSTFATQARVHRPHPVVGMAKALPGGPWLVGDMPESEAHAALSNATSGTCELQHMNFLLH